MVIAERIYSTIRDRQRFTDWLEESYFAWHVCDPAGNITKEDILTEIVKLFRLTELEEIEMNQKEIAEKIYHCLVKQRFADWYNKGNFDTHISEGEKAPHGIPKEQILTEIAELFQIPGKSFQSCVAIPCSQKPFGSNIVI